MPVAAGRKGFKAEVDDLRERMRRLGLGYDEIAGELARRYRARPRESYRLAWGWSLNHAAARFNALSAQEGTDPAARAGMTGPHLCEHERWPDGGRKPSVYVLVMLAQMYETDVLCLLDLADHENLDPRDRLTLIRPAAPRAETPFGRKLVALLDQRRLSLREAARRVPCSASHLSKIAHGKGVSPQLAERLDRLLEASGQLAELAGAGRENPPVVPRAAVPVPGVPGGEGMALWLPYVPGRLVIEASGPAVLPGSFADQDEDPQPVPGPLTLVSGTGTPPEAARDYSVPGPRQAHRTDGHHGGDARPATDVTPQIITSGVLRAWRESRYLSQDQMARRLVASARDAGLRVALSNMRRNVYRWENQADTRLPGQQNQFLYVRALGLASLDELRAGPGLDQRSVKSG